MKRHFILVAASLTCFLTAGQAQSTVILNSSQLTLQATGWAAVNGVYDDDSVLVNPSDTLITSFHNSADANAYAAYFEQDAYGGYWDEANGDAYAGLYMDILAGNDAASFAISGKANSVGGVGSGPGYPVYGEGGSSAQLFYEASFSLTSDYQFSLTNYWANDMAPLASNYLRLESQNQNTVYYQASPYAFDWVTGVLPAGDYRLEASLYCTQEYAGYSATNICDSLFDLEIQLSAVAAVPVPAGLPLFVSGLAAFVVAVRKRLPAVVTGFRHSPE